MELAALLERLRLERLEPQLDAVCEQAAARELDDKSFLTAALVTEWQGRQLRGIEARLRHSRRRWIKSNLGIWYYLLAFRTYGRSRDGGREDDVQRKCRAQFTKIEAERQIHGPFVFDRRPRLRHGRSGRGTQAYGSG